MSDITPNPKSPVEDLPTELLAIEGKPWWKSKTIQGAIVILLALILRSVLGEAAATEPELQHIIDLIINIVDLSGTVVGSVMVIVGRATAGQPLK